MSKPQKSKRGGWLSRLKAGLSRTSANLGAGIGGIFSRGRLDNEALEQLEELLILGDMGAAIGNNSNRFQRCGFWGFAQNFV